MKSVPTTCLVYKASSGHPEPSSNGFRGVLEGSETKGLQMAAMCFEFYCGSKLDEIGSNNLFCCIRPVQGYSKASSNGFRGDLKGSKPCGFRMVFRVV